MGRRYESVYLAAPYTWRDRLREYAEELRAAGVVVTSSWLEEKTPVNKPLSEIPVSEIQEYARRDLDDILRAEVLVLFVPQDDDYQNTSPQQLARGGRHVETGFAYASGKKIVVCGPERENIFQSLPSVVSQATWSKTKKYLLKPSRQRKVESLKGKRLGRREIIGHLGTEHVTAKCDCGSISTVSMREINAGKSLKCAKCCDPKTLRQAVLRIYKYAAKKRDLDWSISDEFFFGLIASPCYFCGDSPNNTYRRGRRSVHSFVYNGVDRLNNEVGYEEINCVPCCMFCNKAKLTRTEDQFFEWAVRVAGRYLERKKLIN